jgi:hypothetical protein
VAAARGLGDPIALLFLCIFYGLLQALRGEWPCMTIEIHPSHTTWQNGAYSSAVCLAELICTDPHQYHQPSRHGTAGSTTGTQLLEVPVLYWAVTT